LFVLGPAVLNSIVTGLALSGTKKGSEGGRENVLLYFGCLALPSNAGPNEMLGGAGLARVTKNDNGDEVTTVEVILALNTSQVILATSLFLTTACNHEYSVGKVVDSSASSRCTYNSLVNFMLLIVAATIQQQNLRGWR